MGYVRDKTGIDLTGGGQRDAAREAAAIQSQAGQQAIETIRSDLAPFTKLGEEAAGQLMASVLQPGSVQVTAQDVLSDPFFKALSEQQSRDTLSQRAALGLAGSGGTENALTRNLLQLGEGFRQQRENTALQQQQARFNQLFNITGLGQSSAAQQGTQTAGLLTDIGTARSTVPLVAANVASQQGQQLLQGAGAAFGAMGGMGGLSSLFGGGAAAGSTIGAGSALGLSGLGMAGFSDARLKHSIEKVGVDEFGGIYEFNYNGVQGRYRGRIAQELRQIKPDAVSKHESGFLRVSDEFRAEAI
jgi:hypothetical protein